MTRPLQQLWDRFKKYKAGFPNLGQSVGRSRVNFVGLLGATMQGFDFDALPRLAIACDDINRIANAKVNLAVCSDLVQSWIGNDKGSE